MAGHNYAGTAPVDLIYALDNGGEIRFFFSDQSLAAALLNGYGQDASGIYQKRRASLQAFDENGRWDLTVFIGINWPDRNPSLISPEYIAFENGGAYDGPRAPWDDLQKQARKQEAADRRVLAKRIRDYRMAVIAQERVLPDPNPFTKSGGSAS